MRHTAFFRAAKMTVSALLLNVISALPRCPAQTVTEAAAQTAAGVTNDHPLPRDFGWVSTWGGSVSSPSNNFLFNPGAYNGNNVYNNQSIRMIVHASLGGTLVRIRLSNELSATPLNIGAAHIALSAGAAAIAAGSDRTVTFNGGSTTVTIPPNAPVLSDPVRLTVPALADLAVSIYLPDAVTITTAVADSIQNNYVSPMGSGDITGAAVLPQDPAALPIDQWPLLNGVEVRSPSSRAFVALGSSVTDAILTTRNANARWTDVLARRLVHGGLPVSVVNASIVADALTFNRNGLGGLARLDSDVFTRPGVAYVFINDILGVEAQQPTTTPAGLIGGLRQLIVRAHSRNVKVYAGTVLPLGGGVGYSDTFEANRQAVNAYIRTGGELDGFADFDAAIRDPANPTVILGKYDGGDHHHPNDLGNNRLAKAFDLDLFR